MHQKYNKGDSLLSALKSMSFSFQKTTQKVQANQE